MLDAIAQTKIFASVTLFYGLSLLVRPEFFLHGPLASLASALFSQPQASLHSADANATSLINIGLLYWVAALSLDRKFIEKSASVRLVMAMVKTGLILAGRGSGALCCMAIADGFSALCMMYTVRQTKPKAV